MTSGTLSRGTLLCLTQGQSFGAVWLQAPIEAITACIVWLSTKNNQKGTELFCPLHIKNYWKTIRKNYEKCKKKNMGKYGIH